MNLGQRKRGLKRTLVVAFAVTGFFIAFQSWDPVPLQILRMKQLDIFQQIKPRAKADTPVTIVDIDDRSLEEFGQWPWPRTQLAQLVRNLMRSGALVIGLDMVFAEADRLSPPEMAKDLVGAETEVIEGLKKLPDSDVIFARAMRNGRVVLGQSLSHEDRPGSISRDARKTSVGFSGTGGTAKRFVHAYAGIVRNRPILEDAAKGIGTTNVLPEFDRVVRRIPLILRAGKELYPSLGLEVLRVATGQTTILAKTNKYGLQAVVVAGLEIPTDEKGQSWIRYAKPDPDSYISAADVMAGTVQPGRLQGQLVLVGTSAAGLQDTAEIPVSPLVPGVEIHAQWLEMVLTKSFLVRPNYILGVEYLVTILFCLALALTIPLAGAITGLFIGASGVAGVTGISWYLFANKGVLLGVTYPVLAGFLLYTTLVLMNYLREETQRREMRFAFNHYLSPDLVGQITADPSKLKLGGEVRVLTFLFTDLAGFTSLVEKSDPDVVVKLLNDYLEPTCDIVMRHGGTIDKIVGDAIHAMFGAPNNQPDHADRAIACALELDTFCRRFEKEKAEEGITFGITRIGVNTGNVVVGNFGGKSRFDYTAHGDAINTAARLESINKQLGTRLCISGYTIDAAGGFTGRPVGELVLKGKEEGIPVFQPLTEEEDRSPGVAAYREAFALMERGDAGALAAFEGVVAKFPDDPLAAFHLARLRAGDTGTRVVFTSK